MARVWDENWFGSTKTLDVHIRWLRQKLGDDPDVAALPAHRARRRLPLHRARGVADDAARAPAAGARVHPAARDRRARGAARAQPARPRRRRGALAGALAGRRRRGHRGGQPRRRPRRLDDTVERGRRDRARPRRGRRTSRARCSPTPPARTGSATDYGDRPEIAAGAARARRSRTAAAATRSTRRSSPPPCRWSSAATRVGVVRVTQSVDAVSRATDRATLGLAAIGLLVLGLGLAAGVVIARQIAGPLRRLDDAARARRRGRPDGARARSRAARSSAASRTTFNGMTARLERARGRPARLRGRRLAPAAHAAQPACGCGSRRRARPATTPRSTRRSTPAWPSSTGSRRSSPSCCVLSQAGEVDAPPERLDLDDAVRRAAARWDGTDGGSVRAVEAAPRRRRTARAPTSTGCSTP